MTCGLNNGIVTYEEQFPDQLKAFYGGVSGYLYTADPGGSIQPIDNREDMYSSRNAVPVIETIFIRDVYAEILKLEQAGSVRMVRYHEMPKERLRLLHEHIIQSIIKQDLPSRPQTEQARFFATYFPALWARAAAQKNTP